MEEKDFEALLAKLNALRIKEGEASYQEAKRAFLHMFVLDPEGKDLLRKHFSAEEIALAEQEDSTIKRLLEMILVKGYFVRRPVHEEVFIRCFDALCITLGGYFNRNPKVGDEGRNALLALLDLSRKVSDMEEAAIEKEISPSIDQAALYESLLRSLSEVSNYDELTRWYIDTKDTRALLTNTCLKGSLGDAINKKQRPFLN